MTTRVDERSPIAHGATTCVEEATTGHRAGVISDRAFRALAQAEPEVIVATLRVLCPGALTEEVSTTGEDLAPTRLDSLAPPRDVDWVARVGNTSVLHLECQGYRDTGFVDRVFEYHLWLVLRHPKRTVDTVALWLIAPTAAQSVGQIVRGNVTVQVTTVVLSQVPAELLLGDVRTACFAPGAEAGSLSEEGLCARVVAVLRAGGASWYRWHMAVVAAAARGRYDATVNAMHEAGVEPVIIEDLIKIGEDRGEARGLLRGHADAVLRVLSARKLAVDDALRARILTCRDAATLAHWLERAVTVQHAGEIEVA